MVPLNETTNLPEERTWPPKPMIAVARVEHDSFLTSVLCAPKTIRAVSRRRLHKSLCRATDLERRYCWRIVDDYCKRYSIFPEIVGIPKLALYVPVSLPIIVFLVGFAYNVYRWVLLWGDSEAQDVFERQANTIEAIDVASMLCAVGFAVLVAFMNNRRQHREADEARAQVEQWMRESNE